MCDMMKMEWMVRWQNGGRERNDRYEEEILYFMNKAENKKSKGQDDMNMLLANKIILHIISYPITLCCIRLFG